MKENKREMRDVYRVSGCWSNQDLRHAYGRKSLHVGVALCGKERAKHVEVMNRRSKERDRESFGPCMESGEWSSWKEKRIA
jgi:hypothetical protein